MTNAKAKTIAIAIATKNSQHDYKKSNIENDDGSSISTNIRKKQYDNGDFMERKTVITSTSTSAREESSRRNNPNEDNHGGGDTNMIWRRERMKRVIVPLMREITHYNLFPANNMNVNTIEPSSTSNQSLMSSSSSSSKMISTRRNRNKSQQQKHQQQRCENRKSLSDDSPSVIDLVGLSFQTTTPKILAATSYHNRNAFSHSKAKRNETYRDIMQGFIDGFSSSDDEDELLGITKKHDKCESKNNSNSNSNKE